MMPRSPPDGERGFSAIDSRAEPTCAGSPTAGGYVGGSPRQYPDRYRFVDSTTHISGSAPPTLVIFGVNDHLVPPAATDSFVRQARAAGVKIDAVRFPYGEHAFNLNQYGIGNQLYLGMTEQFLASYGQRP
jgi:acetyl esterase